MNQFIQSKSDNCPLKKKECLRPNTLNFDLINCVKGKNIQI
jgi:hypothetical protein